GNEILGEISRLEARLAAATEQVQRYQKQQTSELFSGYVDRGVSSRNWKLLNTRQEKTRKKLEQLVRSNLDVIGNTDYDRLQTNLAYNASSQYGLLGVWAKEVTKVDEQRANDLNAWINGANTNPGQSEAARNQPLEDIPNFVHDDSRSMQTELANELKRSRQKPGGKSKPRGRKAGKGTRSETLLTGGDRSKAMDEVLKKLESQGRDQAFRQRKDVADKLARLVDNRMIRRQRSVRGLVNGQAVMQPQRQPGGFFGGSGRAGGPATGAQPMPRAAAEPVDAPIMAGRERRRGDEKATKEDVGGEIVTGEDGGWAAAVVYVAGGTYSLPVTLPEGGTTIDFAAPGGDVEVSVWAFKDETLSTFEATAGIAAVLLLIRIVWALCLRLKTRYETSST
ncbi:hypothetical protein LCGC14_2865450, partial [marine sediment metagenome]